MADAVNLHNAQARKAGSTPGEGRAGHAVFKFSIQLSNNQTLLHSVTREARIRNPDLIGGQHSGFVLNRLALFVPTRDLPGVGRRVPPTPLFL